MVEIEVWWRGGGVVEEWMGGGWSVRGGGGRCWMPCLYGMFGVTSSFIPGALFQEDFVNSWLKLAL